MVLRVVAEVLGEAVDPLGEQCDLDLGRSGVVFGAPETLDELLLLFLREAHVRPEG